MSYPVTKWIHLSSRAECRSTHVARAHAVVVVWGSRFTVSRDNKRAKSRKKRPTQPQPGPEGCRGSPVPGRVVGAYSSRLRTGGLLPSRLSGQALGHRGF